MKFSEINYKFLNKDFSGEIKPIIVFLHEGLGSITQWKNFPEKLCQKLNLPGLVYDRYGYGKSPKWQKQPDVNFLHKEAEFLNDFIDYLRIENDIILFGHSDGGTISLLNAAKPHKNLKAAIIEAPHVILEDVSFSGLKTARGILSNPVLLKKMEKHHGDRVKDLIDKWTSLWLSQQGQDWGMIKELKQIKIPLCLIQGDKDNFGSFEQLNTVKKHAQSEIIEVNKLENCGHIPHFDMTDKVIEIAGNFIKKRS